MLILSTRDRLEVVTPEQAADALLDAGESGSRFDWMSWFRKRQHENGAAVAFGHPSAPVRIETLA